MAKSKHTFYRDVRPKGTVKSVHEAATPEKTKSLKAQYAHLRDLYDQKDALEKQIEAARDACTHEYFYDERGDPYDLRACAGCGKFLGCI